MPSIKGIQALTPSFPSPCHTDADIKKLLQQCSAVIQSGIQALQYRFKGVDKQQRLQTARMLKSQCHACEPPIALIINDDLELALEVDADGLHLGPEDTDLRKARRLMGPDKILGASCRGSKQLAQAAAEAGADYLSFGCCFPSTTKPNAPLLPAQQRADLVETARNLGLSALLIGGINSANISQLAPAAPDCIAVSSGLFDASDPKQERRTLMQALAALQKGQ